MASGRCPPQRSNNVEAFEEPQQRFASSCSVVAWLLDQNWSSSGQQVYLQPNLTEHIIICSLGNQEKLQTARLSRKLILFYLYLEAR